MSLWIAATGPNVRKLLNRIRHNARRFAAELIPPFHVVAAQVLWLRIAVRIDRSPFEPTLAVTSPRPWPRLLA